MIVLRQGKARSILENSINSALTAVEIYNRPRTQFRMENYIILMIIAWTKLFHAYFQSEIGERYFYKEKNGRYKKVDGEKRAWELKEYIKEYQKSNKSYPQLSDSVVANLHFFIGIRNKIEHRYWDSSSLDILLFGECQALLYNYENFLITIFGKDKLVIQRVSNANLLKPGIVVKSIKDRTGVKLSISDHTYLWRSFRVRPSSDAESKFDTISEFCIYDEPHDDYLYTEEWVCFIISLIEHNVITKDNLKDFCTTPHSVKDFK